MPHWALSWQAAAIIAGCIAAIAVLLRRRHSRRMTEAGQFAQETALVMALYGLWQFAGSFTIMPATGATARAQWLWHAERLLRLPDEAGIQRLFLPHPLIVQVFNLYYAILHFPVLITCLVWLYVWHRDRYRRVRTATALFTGAALLIQFVPVAPPRMLAGTGLVDTAAQYGESVYAWGGGFDADQLSAMPSVHVGWALIAAAAVMTVSRSRWRWAAAAYPLLTTLVVIVTANHFWMDGIVAAALLCMVLAAQQLAHALRHSWTARHTPARHAPAPPELADPETAGPEPAGLEQADREPAQPVHSALTTIRPDNKSCL